MLNPGECSLNTAAAGVPAIHLQADFQTRGTLIACQGAWNLFPRPVASLNPYSQAYASSARDILKSAYCLAVANPAVRKIYRADLDADRQDEVVVLATSFAEGLGKAPCTTRVSAMRFTSSPAAGCPWPSPAGTGRERRKKA